MQVSELLNSGLTVSVIANETTPSPTSNVSAVICLTASPNTNLTILKGLLITLYCLCLIHSFLFQNFKEGVSVLDSPLQWITS